MKNETNKLIRDQMIQKVRSSSARPRTRARAPRLHAHTTLAHANTLLVARARTHVPLARARALIAGPHAAHCGVLLRVLGQPLTSTMAHHEKAACETIGEAVQ